MSSLNLYIVTFNCARSLIDAQSFSTQLFNGINGSLPDLIVISLQEIAPIASSFIGGSFLVPHFARVQDAVELAARKFSGEEDAYKPVVARHLGMTAIMAFVRDPSMIQGIETAGVGVGVWEMGNKGAVGLRLSYGPERMSTELTFVAAHLAPMEGQLHRRNEDWKNICRGLVFSSTSEERDGKSISQSAEDSQPLLSVSPRAASIYKPTSHLFVAGDLNYRTSILKPGPDAHKEIFPQPNHPADSPKNYLKLLPEDQLTQERHAGRTLHGLSELPITFPPTYKYKSEDEYLPTDEDASHWQWAPHRWPSWCDRILYLDTPSWLLSENPNAKVQALKYIALPLFPTSDHRPVALSLTIPLAPIPMPNDEEDSEDPRVNPPFDIDPDWRLKRQRARTLELVVGFGAYLTTWEGAFIIAGTISGIVGAYFLFRAALDF